MTERVDLPWEAVPARSGRLRTAVRALRLSGVTSAALALVVALAVGTHLLGVRVTLMALAGGVGLAVTLAALASDRPRLLALGGAALVPVAVLCAASLAVAVAFGASAGVDLAMLAPVVVLLVLATGFGGTLAAVPTDHSTLLARSFRRFLGAAVPLTLVQVGAVAAVSTGLLPLWLATDSPGPILAVGRAFLAPSGSVALGTFLLYVVMLPYLARRVLVTLPFVALFPPDRRARAEARIGAVDDRLRQVTGATVVGAFGLYAVAFLTGRAAPAALAETLGPVCGPVAALLTAVWPRVALLTLLGVLVAALAAEQVRRRVGGHSGPDLRRAAIPAVAALGTTLAAALVVGTLLSVESLLATIPTAARPTVATLLSQGLPVAALTVAFGAVAAVGVLLAVLLALAASPVLPERAPGAALAAGTLFALALAVGLLGTPRVAAVGVAVAALVVWDAGEYAAGLRAELPAGAPTTRGELVHVGASAVVGCVALVGIIPLEWLLTSGLVVPGGTALAGGALAVTVATALALLLTLRE